MNATINNAEIDILKVNIEKVVNSFNKRVLFYISDAKNEIIYTVFITDIALFDIKDESVEEFVEFVWAYINLHFDKKSQDNKWTIQTGIALDYFIENYNTMERVSFSNCKIY